MFLDLDEAFKLSREMLTVATTTTAAAAVDIKELILTRKPKERISIV